MTPSQEKALAAIMLAGIFASVVYPLIKVSGAKSEAPTYTLLAATPTNDGTLAVVGKYETEEGCLLSKAEIEKPWVESVWQDKAPALDSRKRPIMIDVTKKMTWRPIAKCIKAGI